MCDKVFYVEVPWEQRGPGMLTGWDKEGNRVALKPATPLELAFRKEPETGIVYDTLRKLGDDL